MKQYWSEGELVEFWTLTDIERQFSDQRTPRGRLGLAVLLKFFQFEGRFPAYHKEVPLPAVDYVAGQLDVPAITWFDDPLKGRSGSRDREQLRTYLGFRQATSDDAEHIQRWLSQEVVPQDQDPRHLNRSCGIGVGSAVSNRRPVIVLTVSSVLQCAPSKRISLLTFTANSHARRKSGLMPC